jgi:nitrate reductase NapE component
VPDNFSVLVAASAGRRCRVNASDITGLTIVLLVLVIIPIVVLALKGKFGMIALGLFIHPCWRVGAIRLAKPDSYWAERFYDPAKLRRARIRFPR